MLLNGKNRELLNLKMSGITSADLQNSLNETTAQAQETGFKPGLLKPLPTEAILNFSITSVISYFPSLPYLCSRF